MHTPSITSPLPFPTPQITTPQEDYFLQQTTNPSTSKITFFQQQSTPSHSFLPLGHPRQIQALSSNVSRTTLTKIASISPGTRVLLHPTLRIKLRERQIRSIASPYLSPQAIHNIASYIECSQKILQGDQPFLYAKKTETSLEKTIAVDRTAKKIFLLLKKTPPFNVSCGSFKKVYPAIMLPFEVYENGALVAQKVSRDDSTRKERREFQREVKIMKALDLPHLPILGSLGYTSTKGNAKIRKFSSFEPFFTQNLGELFSTTQPPQRLIHISLKIIDALLYFHEQGYIHGDLKPGNILCRKNPQTQEDEVALTDLGFAFAPNKQLPVGSIPSGYYGSVWYTAPELFGVDQGAGIDLFSAERWALGLVLYRLAYNKIPSSTEYIMKIFRQGEDRQWGVPTPRQQAEYTQIITDIVGWAKKDLATARKQRRDSPMLLAIKEVALGLLDPDPKSRMQLLQARNILLSEIRTAQSTPLSLP